MIQNSFVLEHFEDEKATKEETFAFHFSAAFVDNDVTFWYC